MIRESPTDCLLCCCTDRGRKPFRVSAPAHLSPVLFIRDDIEREICQHCRDKVAHLECSTHPFWKKHATQGAMMKSCCCGPPLVHIPSLILAPLLTAFLAGANRNPLHIAFVTGKTCGFRSSCGVAPSTLYYASSWWAHPRYRLSTATLTQSTCPSSVSSASCGGLGRCVSVSGYRW